MDEVESKRRVAVLLREQAAGCGRFGSELYARLLEDAAGDVEAGGPAWRVLEDCAHDPPEEALALRFMGALHRIVLEGGAPRLAAYYPSVGGRAHQRGAWEAFRETLEEQRERLRLEMRAPVQTNEVGRCTALVGGSLLVAGHTGLPLRVLEIGASAGLNLN
jgi:hypothetical protein